MPILTISTNVARSLVTAEMMKSACAMLATSINKPVEKALVQFNMDQLLCFNNSVEPCANLRLCSIGHLGESENIALASDIMTWVEENMNIKADRCYIEFVDKEMHMVGRSKTTIKKLRKQ